MQAEDAVAIETKRRFTISALDFLCRAQERECIEHFAGEFVVEIPKGACVNVCMFKGKDAKFGMAMWSVDADNEGIKWTGCPTVPEPSPTAAGTA
jgi:hypothetical protein